MPDWIVFKQTSNPAVADAWDPVYVNVTAETSVLACKEAAMTRGAGRYMAFPNEYAWYFDITVKQIAEVEVGSGKSMV